MPTEAELTKTIEAEFAQLEDAAARENPTAIEALRVFGTYEQAMQDYDAFLAVLNAPPRFTITNSSG
jgi:hypothetical protein